MAAPPFPAGEWILGQGPAFLSEGERTGAQQELGGGGGGWPAHLPTGQGCWHRGAHQTAPPAIEPECPSFLRDEWRSHRWGWRGSPWGGGEHLPFP